MAKLGQDEIYQGTETFREAFARVPKDAAEYTKLLEKWAAKMGELNSMGDEQEEYLLKYVENLDSIVDSWEEIDDYVEEVLKNLNTVGKTVTNVRNMTSEILKDLQGTGRTITERLKLIRNIQSLSGDISRSLEVEGGTQQKNLEKLYRKAQIQREIGEYTRKMLGTEEDVRYRIWELTAEREKVLEETGGKENTYTQELQRQITLQQTNLDILKLQEQGVYKIVEAEAKRNLEANRSVRRGTKGLGLVARVAEKAGFTGSQAMYEDYVQAQTKQTALGLEESELLGKRASLEGRDDGASKVELLQIDERLKQIVIERAAIELKIRDLGGSQLGIAVKMLKTGILHVSILGLAINAVTKIWKGLKEVSTEAAKLQQTIGTFPKRIASANFEWASAKQYLETANELAQQFGQNPISFIGEKEIAKLAEAKNLLGLSAEQAGNVGIRSKIAGQNIDQYNDSIVQGINHGNALNRSAVAHGVAMKEVLTTSDDLTLSLGNSGERLGRAIVAAKNLGMTLKDVDNIAGQLLNFESSIENEMKAQLLTGNQMNLSRARALALQNDLEGVAQELTKQNINAVKFSEMNRIQQESVASALGMSREQLGKMLVTQAGLSKLTDKQIQDATGVKREQLEAMGISEKWKLAVEKLAQAFTPILGAITPLISALGFIVKIVSGVLGHWWVTWPLLVVAGVMSISSAFVRLSRVGGGVMAGLQRQAVGLGRRVKAAFTGGGVKALFSRGAAQTAQAAGNLPPAPRARGGGWRGLGKGLASFFKAFDEVSRGSILKATLGTIALVPITALAIPLGILAGIGLLAAKTLPALGRGIAGFFKAFQAIPPPVLLIATAAVTVLTGAAVGIGFALKLAGQGLASLAEGAKGLDWKQVGILAALGPTLLLLGLNLLVSSPFLALGSLGLGVFAKRLKKLSDASQGVGSLASNISNLSSSIKLLKETLVGFDTEKLEDIGKISKGARIRESGTRQSIRTGEITAIGIRRVRSQAAGQQSQEREQVISQTDTARIENLLTSIRSRMDHVFGIDLDMDKLGRKLAVETTQG